MIDVKRRLAKATGGKPAQGNAALAALAAAITEAMQTGAPIMLPGIGKFSVVSRHAGGKVTRVAKFDFCTALKTAAARG